MISGRMPIDSDVIVIDVGGKVFKTYRSTLCKVKIQSYNDQDC